MTDQILRWLPHVHDLIYGPPLAIAPDRLEHLLSGLRAAMFQRGSVAETPPLSAAPASSLSSSDDERPHGYSINRGVAVLPIHGVLASRVGQIAPDSTRLQSYENLSRVLGNAQHDSRVRGILLDIDSPGGHAAGVFDLADRIRRVSLGNKPVWAIANHAALSAGYALAAAADRVWTTSSGELGSIGVVAVHVDQSEADAAEGLRYTYIHSGERKIDGHPHAPLSPEAYMAIEAEVRRNHSMLVDQLAQHRRLEPIRLRATEGRIYFGEHAIERGLADHVGTLDQAHAALADHVTPRGRGNMSEAPPSGVGFTEAAAAVDDNVVVQLRVDTEVRAETERCSTIATLCNQHHVPDMIAALQADRKINIDKAASMILERKLQDDMRRQIIAADPSAAAAQQRSIGKDVEIAALARFAAQRRGLYSPD